MGYQDFVSETEAVSIAGVSSKTLKRFTDAGYLHVEIEPDGLRLYSRGEIHEIFGAHQGKSSVSQGSFDDVYPPEQDLSEPNKTESALEGRTSTIAHPIYSDDDQDSYYSEVSTNGHYAEKAERADSADIDHEVARLRNLVNLQERILDMKEGEIADLRAQRDWLQRRVEKLEEKGDRDQILLLSETQTIRRLVTMQESKRSTMRQILDWLGLTPAPQQVPQIGPQASYTSHENAIEVRKAANG
jgi:hypothetical protein